MSDFEMPEGYEGRVLKEPYRDDVPYYELEDIDFDKQAIICNVHHKGGDVELEQTVEVNWLCEEKAKGALKIVYFDYEVPDTHKPSRLVTSTFDSTVKPSGLMSGAALRCQADLEGLKVWGPEESVQDLKQYQQVMSYMKECGFTQIEERKDGCRFMVTTHEYSRLGSHMFIKGSEFEACGYCTVRNEETLSAAGVTTWKPSTRRDPEDRETLVEYMEDLGLSSIDKRRTNDVKLILSMPEYKALKDLLFRCDSVLYATCDNYLDLLSNDELRERGVDVPKDEVKVLMEDMSWCRKDDVYKSSKKPYKVFLGPVVNLDESTCDCGAVKSNTTHARWCSTNG